MKIFSIFILVLCTSNVYSQYLSTYNTPLLGRKYFINEKKVSKKHFIMKLESTPSSSEFYKQHRSSKNISSIFNTGQWIMVLLQINEAIDDDTQYGYGYLAANILFGIGTIYFKNKSNKLLIKSIGSFNLKKGGLGASFLVSPNHLCGIRYLF